MREKGNKYEDHVCTYMVDIDYEKVKKDGTAGAYTVNISGQDMRTQEGTYKKESMTAEEISMQAEQMDMDVQKMYMAVMSNSMSQDEFHKMLEDGYNVSDVDIETIVTILDQIKVAVAKGGGIDGFTDGLYGGTADVSYGGEYLQGKIFCRCLSEERGESTGRRKPGWKSILGPD